MMKKFIKAVVMITAVLVIASGNPVAVRAQEEATEIQVLRFMSATQKVDVKAEPKNNAETIFSYNAGDSVFVTGETQDGWYIVYYQGKTGYIYPKASGGQRTPGVQDAAQDVLVEQEMDIEALDAELEAMEVENKIIVEEVERYRAEVRRSRIWGAIIVLLVIGIFAVGIVSTVRAERKKKEDEDNSSDNREISHNQEIESKEHSNRRMSYNGDIIDLDKE